MESGARMPFDDPHQPDFQLVRDSPVTVFHDGSALDDVVAVLKGIGYQILAVDASRGSLSDCLRQIESEVPEWPAPYVTGLDGLNDGLRELDGRAFAFVLRGYRSLQESEPDAAIGLLNSLASGAWWQMTQGRPLLALVETDLPFAVRVGALPIVTWRGWWAVEDQGRA